MTGTLAIRADANHEIGTGHVTRCMTIAQEWRKQGGRVVFISSSLPVSLRYKLTSSGINVKSIDSAPGTSGDAEETLAIATREKAKWIIVDGYNFGSYYQSKIKDDGISLLVVDDFGKCAHYYADIVVNQNIYSKKVRYCSHEPYTRILAGTKYAMLREEFKRNSIRTIPEIARNILVTFGGSDPSDATSKVINALRKIDDIFVMIIVGGSNPRYEKIKDSVSDNPSYSVKQNVDNISDYMEWADLAISAGGTTYLELMAMNCPSIIVPIADNQIMVAETLQEEGIAWCIKEENIESSKIIPDIINSYLVRKNMVDATTSENEIDGNGTKRIIAAMKANGLSLRKAKLSDCYMIFDWINEPECRNQSLDTNPIPMETHKKWFANAIIDNNFEYYIAMLDNIPVGQARFFIDGNKKSAIIGITIAKEFRGKSMGSLLIQRATEKFFSERTIPEVRAYVKPGNIPSLKSFSEAGYSLQRFSDEHKGVYTYFFKKCRGTP